MNKQLIKMNHQISDHRNQLLVNWSLGNTCNYSCSYCDKVLNDGSIKWQDTDMVLKFCEKIINYYQKEHKKELFFQFTGGEVTFNKDLVKILDYLKTNGCITGIISNGSQKLDFWEKITPYIDHIMLSYHSEYAYNDHYYKVVELLYKNISTFCNIMMLPSKFESTKKLGMKIIDNLREPIVFFELLLGNLFSKHSFSNDYSKKQIDELRELYDYVKSVTDVKKKYLYRHFMTNGYSDTTSDTYSAGEYIVNEINNWKGWICWAGLEQIIVNSNGGVFRAWCVQDWLGNIDQDFIRFPKYPVFCNKDNCHCGSDIRIKRQKFYPL
jgi:organic radical activating enzyme